MELLGQYLVRVFQFTVRGSVRQADSWQILVGGTALPSLALALIYGFLGQKVPEVDASTWATYLGYGLVTWLALRFVIAPFFIWKEQFTETAELRLELSKSERMVLEGLAQHRAKARFGLAGLLEEFQTLSFAQDLSGGIEERMVKEMTKIHTLQAKAGLSDAFNEARNRLYAAVDNEIKQSEKQPSGVSKSSKIVKLMQSNLFGGISPEQLALELPKITSVGVTSGSQDDR